MRLSRHFRSSLSGLSVSAATLISLSTIVSHAQDQTINGNLTVNGTSTASELVANGGLLRLPGNSDLPSGATPVFANVTGFGLQLSTYQFGVATNAATTPNFLIDATGNVGVGTANPAAKLDVDGNIVASGDIIPGGNGIVRGILPVAMYEGASLVNSTEWTNVTRTSYTTLASMFAGVPKLPGTVRKLYLVIRKSDNQPGGLGSYWRFRLPWVFQTGHGFSVQSDWGSTDEGNVMWIEVPEQYWGPATDGGATYWTLDARMINSGYTMRVFSISAAAVDVRGGALAAYVQSDSAAAIPAQITSLGDAISYANGNVGIGTQTPSAKLDVAGDTRVSGNFTVSGAFSAPNYTVTSGAVTGAATGLTVSAGGNEQSVVLQGSGYGGAVVAQNTNGTDSYPLRVKNGMLKANNNYVGLMLQSNDATNPLTGGLLLYGGTSRRIELASYDNGVGPANVVVPYGNMGIGTTTPDKALTVKGTIHATEVVVDTTVAAKDLKVQPKAWADDVFDDDRPLQPLSAVEQSIKEHKHLPGVPSAREVAANGVSVADMQTVLLQKIEELTLHQIEQEKQLQAQASFFNERIAKLEAENADLRNHRTQ